MIEALVGMVLIGILATMAIPKAFAPGALPLRAQARTLASELQRAQLLAITTGNTVTITTAVNAGVTQYTASYGAPATTVITVALDNGVGFKAGSLTTLVYDSLGQPSLAGHFELYSGTVPTVTVNITAVTGMVSVN